MSIFNYIGSPGEKIPQKVLGGGATFFDSHCIAPRSDFLLVLIELFSLGVTPSEKVYLTLIGSPIRGFQ